MFCLRACCCLFSCCALVSLPLLCSRVSSPAVLSCPFPCFALVSLLLLCSRVPSPAVLSCPFSCCAVRASSSSLRAELTRPFFFDGPNSLLHSLALSLAHATSLSPLFHRLLFVWSHWIVLSPSPSNLSNELSSSGTYFLIRFLSFFLFSSSSLAQSTKIWRGY